MSTHNSGATTLAGQLDEENADFRRGVADYRRGALYDVHESSAWIAGWLHEFDTEDCDRATTDATRAGGES